jgi:hypothetical protein
VQYDGDGTGGNPTVDIGTVSGGTNGADLVAGGIERAVRGADPDASRGSS